MSFEVGKKVRLFFFFKPGIRIRVNSTVEVRKPEARREMEV